MSAIETPKLLARTPTFEPETLDLTEMRTTFMPCAICIIQDEIHDMMSRVRRSVYGTMRCESHALECANCQGQVERDTQLLCLGCSYSGAGAVYQEILLSSPPRRMCLFDFTTPNATWTCGCPRCMQETAQFFITRGVEEGFGSLSRSNSPTPSPAQSTLPSPVANEVDEDHISFNVAISIFD